jgi:hypothetical protein
MTTRLPFWVPRCDFTSELLGTCPYVKGQSWGGKLRSLYRSAQ